MNMNMKALLLLRSKSPFSFSFSSSHGFFCFSSICNTINFNHFSSSSSSSSTTTATTISNNLNPIFIDYLINTLGFSKTQADSISKRSPSVQGPKNPDSVVHLLREFGLSETQIRKTVHVSPKILSSDVDRTLKPKLSYLQNELGMTGTDLGFFISKSPSILSYSLQRRYIPNISLLQKELGLTGSDLGHFISKNTSILTCNLERRLIPNINLLKNILLEFEIANTSDLTLVLRRFSWILTRGPEKSKLLSNISFLQSCGIVESQLSTLLKRDPSLLIKKESALRDLVRKAQEMGFSCNSRMLVHAISTLHNVNSKTLETKFQLLRSFGFSQEECSAMFRSTPVLLACSEKKLKLGIDFFAGAGFERKMLVQNPSCLTYSLENRVIPRFRVYQILKSKQQELLKNKCPAFQSILQVSEKRLLEEFVFKFGDNAEELLAAYNNGNVLSSSTEQS